MASVRAWARLWTARRRHRQPKPASLMAQDAVSIDSPMRIGSPEEFACVREFFKSAGFDDVTVCRALAISDMAEFGRVRWEEIRLELCSPALRWCIEVFARGHAVGEQE